MPFAYLSVLYRSDTVKLLFHGGCDFLFCFYFRFYDRAVKIIQTTVDVQPDRKRLADYIVAEFNKRGAPYLNMVSRRIIELYI